MILSRRPHTPIAAQLYDRLFYLADPTTVWVQGCPGSEGESCLIVHYKADRPCLVFPIQGDAERYLCRFLGADNEHGADSPGLFNDAPGRTRQEVLWLLEDALFAAREEGV